MFAERLSEHSRASRVIVRSLFVLILGTGAMRLFAKLLRTLRADRFAFDLHPYFLQSQAILDGGDLYAIKSDLVFPDLETTIPLTYSLVLHPLASTMGWRAFAVLLFFVNLAICALGIGLLIRRFELAGLQRRLFLVIAGLSFPVWHGLHIGQNAVITFVLVAAGICSAQSNPRRAGVWLGLATVIKISPVILLPVLVLVGCWRVAQAMVGTFAVVTTLTHTIVGWRYFGDYWTEVLPDRSARVNPVLWNQSIPATLRRVFGPQVPVTWLVWGTAIVFCVIPFALALRWIRRNGALPPEALIPTLGLAMVAVDLSKSTTWSHHATWHLIVIAWLLRSIGSPGDRVPIPTVLALIAGGCHMIAFVFTGDLRGLTTITPVMVSALILYGALLMTILDQLDEARVVDLTRNESSDENRQDRTPVGQGVTSASV